MRIKDTQCIIPLASLKNGEHSYLFTLDGELFTENQYEDIHGANLKVHVHFNKNSPILMFNFAIEGTVNVTCDRCGDDFDMKIFLQRQLIVKTESREHLEEDDMTSLTSGEKDMDIAPYVYQYLVLSLPMQRLHPADTDGNRACNQEAIKKLKNMEVDTSSEEQYIRNKHLSNKEEETKE